MCIAEFCVKTLMYRCWRLKKAPQFDIILLCFSFNSFFCKIFLQIFFPIYLIMFKWVRSPALYLCTRWTMHPHFLVIFHCRSIESEWMQMMKPIHSYECAFVHGALCSQEEMVIFSLCGALEHTQIVRLNGNRSPENRHAFIHSFIHLEYSTQFPFNKHLKREWIFYCRWFGHRLSFSRLINRCVYALFAIHNNWPQSENIYI